MSFPPKRVLVATDFSEPAGIAADAAVALAKPLGATLVLVHVTSPIAFVDYAEGAVDEAR
jgi:nucleotide-binding universal stress UspA family protein